MRWVQDGWRRVWKRVLTPGVDEQAVARHLQTAKSSLPPPVFWLLGKAQAGKTSLIHALTGNSRAAIGDGFRPCTPGSQLYSFPNDDECFLQFLDTRGLGDVGHDPTESLGGLESQAHLLIVVMKAMDHAQECVLDIFRQIVNRHPRWPVIVLQTALHEGYAAGSRHAIPYPYAELPYAASVPSDVARSLAAQRELFDGYRVRFVPVDFTLPEDGFDPVDYGLDALWTAIEELLPLGLQGMLGQTPAARRLRDEFFQAAHPHVVVYALAAGGVGGIPLPLVDMPLVLTIQAKMLHTIASIYRQPMDVQRMAEIASALGVGFLMRWGVREMAKVVPGLGSSVSALYAAASTYGLGMALCQYFSRIRAGDMPNASIIGQLYAEEFRRGREWIAERMQLRRAAGEAPP